MTKPSTTATQRSLREVIADDSHALTFQTSGQYRAALLKHQPMEHTHHAEAFAWAVFAKDDNVIIWSKNRVQVESASKEYGRPIVPVIALFAAEQGAAPVPPTYCDPAEGFCAKCREQERAALAHQRAPTVPAEDELRADADRYQMLKKHAFHRTVQGYDGPILQWTLTVPACDDDCADFDAAMDQYGSLADYVPHYPVLAHQPAQEPAEPQHPQFDASKGYYWFSVLLKCARLLDLPDDEPIPSGVLAAVEKLIAAQLDGSQGENA
jgi:hypothetical protein